MTSIAIIDYEIGNIRSIVSAFEKMGVDLKLTKCSEEILDSDGVVLPGVGAFAHGMAKLKEHALDGVIKEFAATGKPILGICLGMQLLLTESYEFGYTEGLGLIPGTVKELKLLDPEVQKLPHVSWNELSMPAKGSWDKTILQGVMPKENMYYVHSYMAIPKDENHILSTTIYSNSEFCSSVRNNNIFGCQFHPEKSAKEGLKIISNFVRICEVKKNG